MSLTDRGKQFLRLIVGFHDKTRLPVHYATIAELIGVSKWTAYGIFKQLEKQGYLQRDYAVHSGLPGRSQVVFVPTRQTLDLFRQATVDTSEVEEWTATKGRLMEILNGLTHQNSGPMIKRILADLPQIESRLAFLAHVLALFLVYLRIGIGKSGRLLIARAVEGAPQAQMALAVFVGLVMGTGLKDPSIGLGLEIVDVASQFLNEVASQGEQQTAWLLEFVTEGMHQAQA